MEGTIKVHMEERPKGYYQATSEDVQGLVAQGRTITETLEIARDSANKLMDSQSRSNVEIHPLDDEIDYPLVIGM